MSSITKQTNKVGFSKQEKVRYQNRYKVVNDCLLKCGGKGIKLAGITSVEKCENGAQCTCSQFVSHRRRTIVHCASSVKF